MDYNTKIKELQALQNQVMTLKNLVDAKEGVLQSKESQLRQGQLPVTGPRALKANMDRAMQEMSPGNVGDINRVIWPYYFTTQGPATAEGVGPNETLQSGFTVTQEAAFIVMSYTKAVYNVDPVSNYWTYNDPNANQQTPGLFFTLRDTQSGRDFFNVPIALDNYGNPRFPTKLPRPIMFLPNSNVQVNFINSNPINQYAPFITFFGYRIRIEDAQNLLGLVYG